VLILKIVKVVCFDTLLQVLIAKGLEEESNASPGRSPYVAEALSFIGSNFFHKSALQKFTAVFRKSGFHELAGAIVSSVKWSC